MFFRRKRKRRGLVIGLDGVPKELVERLADDDVIPYLATFLRSGTLHQTTSALPEISSVNWASFMTGANPGGHGIFGFTDLDCSSYALRFPSFPDLKTDTLWDRLGRAGKRCLVLNQPGCYPARTIPGVLVSGFVAVDLARAVAPRQHAEVLQRMDYRIDVNTQHCKGDSDALFRELEACLDSRERAAGYLFGLEDWDFAEVVITGTDRLQHFLWTSCDGNGPERARAMAYYRKCDALIRRLVEQFYGSDDPEGLFLLSDHGFTHVAKQFMLNAWLRREGYLSFEKEPPESYADIAPSSQAFAMDPGRIYIHRKGRYPKGRLAGDGPLEEIKAKLEALEYEGNRVFERVWQRDEIYTGPETPNGPELLCTPRRGIDVKGGIKNPQLYNDTHFTGMHTWDNAFFWAQQDYGRLAIAGLAPLIIEALLA